MEHKYNSKLERDFSEYLVRIGYPKDSIIYEPAFLASDGHRRYRPDFLIIDPIKKERLAIIEVKGTHLKNTESTYQQLVAYRNAIGDTEIPVFLVTPSESENVELPFDLHVFNNDGHLIKSDFSLFPTFLALTAEDAAERKSVLRSKKSSITSSFQNVSWGLAFLLLVVGVADFICAQYKITLLTTERMALLGACVALVVIPFAQKFKGLGIEWEKATKDE